MNHKGKYQKKHYGIILACLIISAVGFGTVYKMEEQRQKKEQLALEKSKEKLSSQVSGIIEPKSSQVIQKPSEVAEIPSQELEKTKKPEKPEETQVSQEKVEPPKVVETIADYGIGLPVQNGVVLDYSMDKTIYFPTLDVYKCNPAMIYSAKVNDKVYIVGKGSIRAIYEDAETGCTVVQDLGGGFEAVYGQLKDVTFEVGDQVEAGHVVGLVKEPTKYYVKEGANVYFQLKKDGNPVDPKEYFR